MRITTGMNAVVTGAANGLGAALATLLAERGVTLELIDCDGDNLHDIARGLPVRANCHILDVSQYGAVQKFADGLRSSGTQVAVLINCAGQYLSSAADVQPEDRVRKLIDVNLLGPIWFCRHLLPLLRESRRASIVNICSTFGLVGAPRRSAYCASKWGLRGYSESLRAELDGGSVTVTTVFAGAIQTNLVLRAGGADSAVEQAAEHQFLQVAGISAAQAAKAILLGVERGVQRLRVGC